MKKGLLLILVALMALLLTGCDLLVMERIETNPINERTTAIVFDGQDESGMVYVVTDAETIAGLGAAYRWTHAHMRCCLEGEVAEVMDFLEGSRIAPWELSRDRLYASDDVPAYNAAYRKALRAARESAVPMYRTEVLADLPQRAAEVEAALPGSIVAVSSYRGKPTDWLDMYILTPEPLTAEELSLLRHMDGVRVVE